MQKKSKVKFIINLVLLCAAVPAAVISGFFFFGSRQYYILSAVIIAASILPFFISFERKKSPSKEIAVLASITAVAVIGRAAFYSLPQIKPVAAVVIVAAVCFGYETGFLTGALSMFLSDIFFGFGIWTPFQMLGLGLTGLICGLIFRRSSLKFNRFVLGITGGIVTFIVYGFIADSSSVLFLIPDFSCAAVLSVYSAGILYNAIFAAATAVLLILFGKTFIEKLRRIKNKYGIFKLAGEYNEKY